MLPVGLGAPESVCHVSESECEFHREKKKSMKLIRFFKVGL